MNELIALGQVVLIDLVLAGDNALVIGALAAKLPDEQRKRAVIIGLIVAIAARLLFTATAASLLLVPGINLIGGLLLLWIAYKLWQDQQDDSHANASNVSAPASFGAAVRAIVVADITMSLDNILGVAGAAHGHAFAMFFGLLLSMILMGSAANWIAGQMSKRPWLIYVGIAAIVFAGLKLISETFS